MNDCFQSLFAQTPEMKKMVLNDVLIKTSTQHWQKDIINILSLSKIGIRM